MPIDWLTVAAQAINFLVLVLLLQHFLYRPVVRAMDRRQERVASRLHEAEEEREAAEEERTRLAEERAELESRREEILRGAREEAQTQRERLLREAREEAERRERAWGRELERRAEQVASDLAGVMGEHVAEAMRRGFDELAGADVRAAATDRFLRRLEALEEPERERLAEAMRDADVEVRVAAEPSDDAREELAAALEMLGADRGRIAFHEDPGLLAGVEVRAGGRRVAWSLRRHVDELERALREAMDEPAREAAAGGGDEPGDGSRDEGGTDAGAEDDEDDAEDAAPRTDRHRAVGEDGAGDRVAGGRRHGKPSHAS